MVLSLDSLLNTKISSAAKYQQTISEAASSVTIITAEDIQRHGYQTLPEALAATRGFYLSYDRNYAFLGARGFSRPSDYNNRILLLVDGNATNEGIFGGAPVGTDLGVPLSSLERIEIVRGPGSALYGTGAIFAVVNLVTKPADAASGRPRRGARRQLRRPRRLARLSWQRRAGASACRSAAPGTAPTGTTCSTPSTIRPRTTAASRTTWTGSAAGRCSARCTAMASPSTAATARAPRRSPPAPTTPTWPATPARPVTTTASSSSSSTARWTTRAG